MRKGLGIIILLVLAAGVLIESVPAIADNVIDVSQTGAVGDGVTLDTASIQKAIDNCAAAGGGTVKVGAGKYLIGSIQLKSHVTLHLDDQATLLGSTDAADYRNLDPFIDGVGNPMGHALIMGIDADYVGIEGSGTIDGQGAGLQAREKPFVVRPFLVRWVRCTHVTVKDVHLTNPGAWTLNFFRSSDVDIEGITIRSRDELMRNNDGINIDSSKNVQVKHCDVISGDDSLVIKSTSEANPCTDISADDCKLAARTNAIKLGTESIGGFDNINISHCQITNTGMSGIALYTVDGGDLRRVNISDVSMDGVAVAISMRLGARLKIFREGDQPRQTPGHLSDIKIKNVTAKNIGFIGMLINGVPGHPIQSLDLNDIQLTLPGGGTPEAAQIQLHEEESAYPEFDMFGLTMPAYAIYARHVSGIKLQKMQTSVENPDARPATVFVDVSDVTPADFEKSSNLK